MADTGVARPAYLSAREVAGRLNVSTRHVYTLICAGDLESANFGTGRKGIRVPAESLSAFEDERRARTSGALFHAMAAARR